MKSLQQALSSYLENTRIILNLNDIFKELEKEYAKILNEKMVRGMYYADDAVAIFNSQKKIQRHCETVEKAQTDLETDKQTIKSYLIPLKGRSIVYEHIERGYTDSRTQYIFSLVEGAVTHNRG